MLQLDSQGGMSMNNTKIQLRKQAALTALIIAIAITLSINIPLEPTGNTTNTTVLFNWIGLANTILIDDNSEFTSPRIITESANLEPGKYYWKTNGISTKKQFKIDTEVTIALKTISNNKFNIENQGNTDIRITNKLTGAAVIEPKQNINKTTEDSRFLAQQNE